MDRENVVTAVIAAAGEKLTGKVRLQKVFYFLEQLGLRSGFDYEYRHYGPFSAELAETTEIAKALGLIEESLEFRTSDGARYSVFRTSASPSAEAYGELDESRVRELMGIFRTQSSTVLELAATIDWLQRFEQVEDWRSELSRRKALTATEERIAKAEEVLRTIELPPPRVAA